MFSGLTIRRAYNRAQYMTERIEMMKWWGNFLENNGLKTRLLLDDVKN